MNKLTLTTLKRMYLLAGPLLVVIGATIVFGIMPNLATISDLVTDIHDQRIQLEILKQERTNLVKTQQDYNLVKNNIDQLNEIFIRESNIIEVLAVLESLAENNGIQENISIVSTPDKNDESLLTLSLSITGGWTQVTDYIHDLEQLPYYMILHDLSMSGAGDSITISFKANTYAQ